MLVALVAVPALPPPEATSLDPGNGTLDAVWYAFNLPGYSTQTFVLASSFSGDTLYTWTAGLRTASGSFDQNIRWSIEYTYGEKETAFTYRWYAGEADWLSLEFVTPASTSGTFVLLKVTNAEATGRVMEYASMSRVVESSRTRSADTVSTGTTTLWAFSGIQAVWWSPNLAADTLYVFNVRVYLINDPDNAQTVAWLWRCYRSTSDPPTPSNVGQSRHHERWGDDSWTNTIWASREAGSYCGLWINNWDPNAQQFAWVVRFYTAGPASRVTEDSDEGAACLILPPGFPFYAIVTPNLLPGRPYIATGRVILNYGLGGDVDHKAAVSVGLRDRGSFDEGIFQGYQLRYWTDFQGIYNPWVEGIVLTNSTALTQELVIRITNTDTVAREFCYVSSVVSF